MSSYLAFNFSGTSLFHRIFTTNLSIWNRFFSTSFQDGEKHKEYFCQKLSAQIKNSATVSEWKKHKDIFLSNMSIQTNWSLSKALQIPK